MILEVNKLFNSEHTYFKEIGRFLYFRDLNNGLSKDEVNELLELLSNNDRLEESIYHAGYKDGYTAGEEDNECFCDCD